MTKSVKGQQGMALIMIMVIALILVSFAIYFANSVKIKLANAEILYDKAGAQLDVDNALASTTFWLFAQNRLNPKFKEQWNFWGEPFLVGGDVEIKITDFSARLSVVPFDEGEWRHALASKGVSKKKINRVIAQVKDWQDKDQNSRTDGMEVNQYAADGYAIRPRDDYMQFKWELLKLPAVDEEILQFVEEDVVYYGSGNRMPLLAPVDMVSYYYAPEVARQILSLRRNNDLQGLFKMPSASQLIRGNSEFINTGLSGIFILEMVGKRNLSTARRGYLVSTRENALRPFFYASIE